MATSATIHRTTTAASLIACAGLTVVSVALMPDFSGDATERLEAIAAAGSSATVSAMLFTIAQLFFAIGFVGVARVLSGKVPVLAWLAAALAVLSAFGHAVYGGVGLTMIDMAADPANHDTYAAVLAAGESGLMIPFLVMGLLGTVLALVLMAVAVWRSRLAPRWVPAALVGFVLVEFLGSALSEWSTYAAGLLYVVALGALAVLVWRSPEPRATTSTSSVECAEPAVERGSEVEHSTP